MTRSASAGMNGWDAAHGEPEMNRKILAGSWFLLGLVFVVEAIGGSPAIGSVCAMFCGFMTARNIADIVQPNT